MKNVCVIGVGPSGLAAAKNPLDASLRVTVFERQTGVGGNWRFSNDIGHSSVFKTTHITSPKCHSAFLDYPIPAHFPDHPSHAQLLEHFGLLPHCEPLPDDR